MNSNNKKYLMIPGERWERYDDKWRKGRTGKFTTPNELVSPTFPAKAESLKWWWSWLLVVIRQNCCLNICKYIGWVDKYCIFQPNNIYTNIEMPLLSKLYWLCKCNEILWSKTFSFLSFFFIFVPTFTYKARIEFMSKIRSILFVIICKVKNNF